MQEDVLKHGNFGIKKPEVSNRVFNASAFKRAESAESKKMY